MGWLGSENPWSSQILGLVFVSVNSWDESAIHLHGSQPCNCHQKMPIDNIARISCSTSPTIQLRLSPTFQFPIKIIQEVTKTWWLKNQSDNCPLKNCRHNDPQFKKVLKHISLVYNVDEYICLFDVASKGNKGISYHLETNKSPPILTLYTLNTKIFEGISHFLSLFSGSFGSSMQCSKRVL